MIFQCSSPSRLVPTVMNYHKATPPSIPPKINNLMVYNFLNHLSTHLHSSHHLNPCLNKTEHKLLIQQSILRAGLLKKTSNKLAGKFEVITFSKCSIYLLYLCYIQHLDVYSIKVCSLKVSYISLITVLKFKVNIFLSQKIVYLSHI